MTPLPLGPNPVLGSGKINEHPPISDSLRAALKRHREATLRSRRFAIAETKRGEFVYQAYDHGETPLPPAIIPANTVKGSSGWLFDLVSAVLDAHATDKELAGKYRALIAKHPPPSARILGTRNLSI